VTNGGVNGFPSVSGAAAQWDARYAAAIPPTPASGNYFYTASDAVTSTSSTLGNGTLRLIPWLVQRPMTIDRLGAEVTTIGESGSKFRIGIYLDSGYCYPGNLLIDAGQIAGDSATVQTLSISVGLAPGLYWIGGAAQAAPTTQPTMRTMTGWVPPVHMPVGTSTPASNQAPFGYTQTSVTGALPAAFTTTVSLAGNAARIFARIL
jgi:hypothetical protein